MHSKYTDLVKAQLLALTFKTGSNASSSMLCSLCGSLSLKPAARDFLAPLINEDKHTDTPEKSGFLCLLFVYFITDALVCL